MLRNNYRINLLIVRCCNSTFCTRSISFNRNIAVFSTTYRTNTYSSISNAGVGIGTADAVYTKVPIKGNGSAAECTVTINSSSQVSDVTVSTQGSGYTYGSVDLVAGGVPTGTTRPVLDVVISPPGGHGK